MRLRKIPTSFLFGALIAILLTWMFVYVPRQNRALAARQLDYLKTLNHQLSVTEGQLSAADSPVQPASPGSAQALTTAYLKTLQALPTVKVKALSNLIVLPWDSKPRIYNNIITDKVTPLTLSIARSRDSDMRYLKYQTAVWKDIFKVVEYQPAQDNDPVANQQDQAAAQAGITKAVLSIKALPAFPDPQKTELLKLLQQGENSAANSPYPQFVSAISDIQPKLISNRGSFSVPAEKKILNQLSSQQAILNSYITTLQGSQD